MNSRLAAYRIERLQAEKDEKYLIMPSLKRQIADKRAAYAEEIAQSRDCCAPRARGGGAAEDRAGPGKGVEGQYQTALGATRTPPRMAGTDATSIVQRPAPNSKGCPPRRLATILESHKIGQPDSHPGAQNQPECVVEH